jgi:hypothetical protein
MASWILEGFFYTLGSSPQLSKDLTRVSGGHRSLGCDLASAVGFGDLGRTRAGTPAAIALAGIERVTTLPEPIMALSPMVTPSCTAGSVACDVTHQALDVPGGQDRSPSRARSVGCRWCVAPLSDLPSAANGRAEGETRWPICRTPALGCCSPSASFPIDVIRPMFP